MNRKFGVRGAEAGNEVTFECLDAAFGSIASMDARWDKLIFDVFFMEEFFEGFRAFIVKALEFGSEASFT
jgi:hypothetical protein